MPTKVFMLFIILGPSAILADHKTDMASFQIVWETIRDKHWDLESTGIDWEKIHETYQPRAEKAADREALRTVINEMIAELGQTHFGLMGGDQFKSLEALREGLTGGSGVPGFEVKAIEGRAFITKINPESKAADLGFKLGTEIISVRSKPMTDVVRAVEKAFESSAQKGLYITRVLNEFLTGPIGEEFNVEYMDRGEVQSADLVFEKGKGITETFGNLPPITFDFEQKRIGNFGYVSFNIFLMPLINPYFPNAIETFTDTEGFIIDLRGNSGGIGYLASGLAGYFVAEKGRKLGTMHTKDSHMNFIVVPRPKIYEKPLAILIDEGSASTSEILAAGMRDLGRARLFGSRSAGAALPSFIEELPNGDRFQYAFANYISDNGLEIEGKGVTPDEITPHTLESLSAGKDNALEAAIAWIAAQAK